MLEINFSEFPELHTDRLHLRELQQEDAPALFALRTNPTVMRYLDRPMMQSEGEARDLIVKVEESYAYNEGILWALSLKDRPGLIGTIGFWKFDKENHRAEIGYLLDPAQQGKGLMSEALAAVLKYGFEILRLHSIEANTNPANKASQTLLERAGFVQEAYFKENYFFNGQFLDSAIYSLITPVKA